MVTWLKVPAKDNPALVCHPPPSEGPDLALRLKMHNRASKTSINVGNTVQLKARKTNLNGKAATHAINTVTYGMMGDSRHKNRKHVNARMNALKDAFETMPVIGVVICPLSRVTLSPPFYFGESERTLASGVHDVVACIDAAVLDVTADTGAKAEKALQLTDVDRAVAAEGDHAREVARIRLRRNVTIAVRLRSLLKMTHSWCGPRWCSWHGTTTI